jgi:hypothetical protein
MLMISVVVWARDYIDLRLTRRMDWIGPELRRAE